MRRRCTGAQKSRGGHVEETVRAEVAPGGSLNGMRQSEKAEMPEKTGAETFAGCEPPPPTKKLHTRAHTAYISRSYG